MSRFLRNIQIDYPPLHDAELFRYQLDPGTVDEIRASTNGNFALGDSPFQAQVAAALGRRVTRGKSGRPRKRSEGEPPALFDGS